MAIPLQLRRGTKAQNDVFTGALGEVTVDTENKNLRLHDGSTAGGVEFPNSTNVLTGFKNHIINGGFDIWQRGESFTEIASTNNYYADRFRSEGYAFTGTITKDIFGYKNAMKIAITDSSDGYVDIGQRIEELNNISDKTMTLSFYIKADAVTSNIRVNNNYDASQIINVTTSWQKITQTITYADISEQGYHFFGIRILQNYTGNIYIANFQLEEGSVATPFEQRPIGLELSLCQRYYQDIGTVFCNSAYNSVTNLLGRANLFYRTDMRTTPSVSKTVFGGSALGDTSVSTNKLTLQLIATTATADAGYSDITLDAEL